MFHATLVPVQRKSTNERCFRQDDQETWYRELSHYSDGLVLWLDWV